MVATNFFWATQSRANNVGRTMSQHIHFESQWLQQFFFGPHKFAQVTLVEQCRNIPILSRNARNKLFWATQSRANNFGRTIPILSRNGRNKLFFGLHKVAQITSIAQCRNISILSRNGRNKLFFGPHKFAQITSVAQCRNLPILSRNGRIKSFLGHTKSRK